MYRSIFKCAVVLFLFVTLRCVRVCACAVELTVMIMTSSAAIRIHHQLEMRRVWREG